MAYQAGTTRIALKKRAESDDDPRLSHACGFEKCMQCGRCTASCPAAYIFEDYRPRDVMRRLQLGDTSSLSPALWRCGQCYSCAARCPRNNSVAAGILALREAALSRGTAPENIKNVASLIQRNLHGRGETFLPATFDFLSEFGPRTVARCKDNPVRRARLGFDPVDARPAPIPGDAMAEIRTLLELTGFGGGEDA